MRAKRIYDIESERAVLSFCAGVALAAALAVAVGWFVARTVICGGAQ